MEVNGIVIDIEYKPIKHIHLSVYPPEGNVHASVPNGMSEPQIRLFILSKYMWLKSKIDEEHNEVWGFEIFMPAE